ncbi:Hypothetical predicted protein [Mytilus galloprovincialis]|uniref:Uncharacterized protein n=1 Tax=Mytilus galloprovincialis TaxID=29158 RepID=A0A8B6BPI6_MYTGA|nr:Hypothetical predicted protein [Mytilus galloprovincialis]
MSDKYIENNPDSYKPYTMDRNTAPAEIDVPYYQNNKEHSVNRLREMKLAQTFLRWLMTSGERSNFLLWLGAHQFLDYTQWTYITRTYIAKITLLYHSTQLHILKD